VPVGAGVSVGKGVSIGDFVAVIVGGMEVFEAGGGEFETLTCVPDSAGLQAVTFNMTKAITMIMLIVFILEKVSLVLIILSP
jgi:hypothetical protein